MPPVSGSRICHLAILQISWEDFFPVTTHCAVISENGLPCGHEKSHFLHPADPAPWNGTVTGQEIFDLLRLHLWKGKLWKCSMQLLSGILLRQGGTHGGVLCRSCGIKFKQTLMAATSCASKTSSGCGSEMSYPLDNQPRGPYFFSNLWKSRIFQTSAAQCFFNASSSDVPHCISRRSADSPVLAKSEKSGWIYGNSMV